MRKFAIVFLLLILPIALFAGELPQPSLWVNDFAGVIAPEYRDKLTGLIQGLEEKTSAEIAVVTVDSIAPYDEIEYSRRLFDRWKPGKKGKDNGVLVLLAVKERRWRIETGYGIEGILPDGLCGEIGRNYMVPYFKTGNYSEGLYSGVSRIAAIISGDTLQLRESSNTNFKRINSSLSKFAFAMFGLGFFFLWNIPWPIFIGLPATLLFATAFAQMSPIMGVFPLIGYAAAMVVRYFIWKNAPEATRGKFWKWVILGLMAAGVSSHRSRDGFGGFGGGGFGGGGGGGGGSGGGF